MSNERNHTPTHDVDDGDSVEDSHRRTALSVPLIPRPASRRETSQQADQSDNSQWNGNHGEGKAEVEQRNEGITQD